MDAFYQRLAVRAATIDELLSDEFESQSGQKGDAEASARRLAAWCRSCASGDWALFERRLARDGLTFRAVLERLSTVRRKPGAPAPAWLDDAAWVAEALQAPSPPIAAGRGTHAFEHLFAALVEQAEVRLKQSIDPRACDNLDAAAWASLRRLLLKDLSGLCAAALYERFAKARKDSARATDGTTLYDEFVRDMQRGGWRQLFEDKPVLLRLIAVLTHQWLDTKRELVTRLAADLTAIRGELLHTRSESRVSLIEAEISDPHNNGRAVHILTFADGARVLYKPKDLRLDLAWHNLVARLNAAKAPVSLRTVRVLVRDGYGWTEFIDHDATDTDGCTRFFRRAGAWLALFHCFAAADMHQENMIASSDHPVPIDLETMLHASAEPDGSDPAEEAGDAARDRLANSVMAVGLLPAYGRSPFNNVFAIGGMTSGWTAKSGIAWTDINADAMRPKKSEEAGTSNPNLPHSGGRYAKFVDHVDDVIAGFEDYARFLLRQTRDADLGGLFDGFAAVPVRKVVRPTRFYYLLLQRLKNHQSMSDGVLWSAQADFIARLSEWDGDDPRWGLQKAERLALTALNVPHFFSPSDGLSIGDATGIAVTARAASGLERARQRVRELSDTDIAWQIEVIRANTASPARAPALPAAAATTPPAAAANDDVFLREADRIAQELADYAIRRGPGAAWMGLDWLGDAEVFQLIALGPDLYNGTAGIALFLAGHAAARRAAGSAELARAALASLRKNLKSRNAARFARSLGVGGGTGLGSVIYALTVVADCLGDPALREDAQKAAELFTDDLIAADRQLDVLGGAAGAILGLLRLYRDSGSEAVLRRAVRCGDHLMAQARLGEAGHRSWIGQGMGAQPLNGMSHGAAGFAYALSSLAAASGRDDFAQAAAECVALEDSRYDAGHSNWPDLRAREPAWPCQWCHGAPGIGLARIASTRHGRVAPAATKADIDNAVRGVMQDGTAAVDTLCCGTLGRVEFLCEAGAALGHDELRRSAANQLAAVLGNAAGAGDFRWNSGSRRFNLGLFRGLAGVGYTALRQAGARLPNVLVWE